MFFRHITPTLILSHFLLHCSEGPTDLGQFDRSLTLAVHTASSPEGGSALPAEHADEKEDAVTIEPYDCPDGRLHRSRNATSPEDPMDLTIGLISDLHFGDDTFFDSKLRKLGREAGRLTGQFSQCMNTHIHPDFIVNLGDDVEDKTREADYQNYRKCHRYLATVDAPLVNVVGNHDTKILSIDELLGVWNRSNKKRFWADKPYYSFDVKGWHFIVLHTFEQKDIDITLFEDQVQWVTDDLQVSLRPTIVFVHHSFSDQNLDDSRWFARAPHLALVKNRADVRRIFEQSGRVRAVINGHVHRNHIDIINSIPYITLTSLTENLDEDQPGRPSAAHTVITLSREKMLVKVHGNDKASYQIAFDNAR